MSTNIILAQPNPIQLAVGVEKLLTVGGNAFTEGQPQTFDPSHFQLDPRLSIEGTSIVRNASAYGNARAIGLRRIPIGQPFSAYGAWFHGAGNLSIFIGILDNLGRESIMECYRYPPETQFRFNIYRENTLIAQGSLPYFGASNNEGFRVDSDGRDIIFYHQRVGQFSQIYRFPIGEGVTDHRFMYVLGYANNRISLCHTRIEDITIPLNTNNLTAMPRLLDLRPYDGQRYAVKANVLTTTARVTLTYGELTTTVRAVVSPLYLKPSDRDCGGFVIQGETVQFVTNGEGGTFSASTGTVLPDMKWQAPFTIANVQFEYLVNNVSATCTLRVVPKLTVLGLNEDNSYPDLMQGESVQFESTCPEASYSSPSHPNIVSPSGLLRAPNDERDEVFGAKDVLVKVVGCNQTFFFSVHIQAMYPTDKFCGARPVKWIPPNIRDYLPNTLTMTGGTSQVKNRNRDGIAMWKVNYENLAYDPLNTCACNETGLESGNCAAFLASAKRLDAFYAQVRFTRYFSLYDYQTDEPFKYVRLTDYQGDHVMYLHGQTRTLEMRYEGDL